MMYICMIIMCGLLIYGICSIEENLHEIIKILKEMNIPKKNEDDLK